MGCALSLLTVGGLLAGAAGLTVIAVFCLAVIPVLGFTRCQVLLLSKGRELSGSVEDVRSLMGINAWARPRGHRGDFEGTRPGALHMAGHGTGSGGATGAADDGASPQATPTAGTSRPAPYRHTTLRTSGFWDALSTTERDDLGRISQTTTFGPGEVLFHEGAVADHVLLLRSGQVKVCLHRACGERILTLRGPGDLVGERAAIEVSRRSATVEALGTVQAWVLPTGVFRAFLERHPRVVRILEDQIYGRLTEESPEPSDLLFGASTPSTAGRTAPTAAHPPTATALLERSVAPPAWTGQNCSILYTDIAGFSAHIRTDEDRRIIRRVMYDLIREACEESGLPWSACHHEDRGDGTLIVIPPSSPTGHAVDPLLSRLATGLRQHNRRVADVVRLQLRLALHVGPVISETDGVTGHSIIHTARLLDAPVLKAELTRTGADLGFITSAFVYDGSIRHGGGRPDATEFREVSFQVKESATTAWMWLHGGTA